MAIAILCVWATHTATAPPEATSTATAPPEALASPCELSIFPVLPVVSVTATEAVPELSVCPFTAKVADYELPMFFVDSVTATEADFELSELPITTIETGSKLYELPFMATEANFELSDLSVTAIVAVNDLSVVCFSFTVVFSTAASTVVFSTACSTIVVF